MEEVVVRLEDFPDYFISNLGNIYSTRVSPRSNPNGSLYKLTPWQNHPSGYINIGMYNEPGIKNKTYRRLHRLVWEAFKGEIPKGYVIDHKNADKKDNRLDNLQLLTHQENALKYHRKDKLKNKE